MANNAGTVCFFLLLTVWKCLCRFSLNGNPSFAVVGERINITLTCISDDNHKYVKWLKYTKENASLNFVNIAEIKQICEITVLKPHAGYVYTCNIPKKEYFLTIPIQSVEESVQDTTWKCAGVGLSGSEDWNLLVGVLVSLVNITPKGVNNVIKVEEDEVVNFTCTTNPSSPPASIEWYINDQNVTNHTRTETKGGIKSIAFSTLVYTAKNVDHDKNIYCIAGNIENRPKVNSTEIKIYVTIPVKNITFSPDSDTHLVTIVEGNIQIFSCTTVPSRPAALIQWFIGGVNVTNQANLSTIPDEDKLISFSTLNYTGKDADHNTTIHCEAVNIKGKDSIKSATQYISIQVPVKTLTIDPAGVSNVTYVVSGEKQNFTCSTSPCRPPVSIQWNIAGQDVTNGAQADVTTQDGELFISTSTLLYNGTNSDHNKIMYCETVNLDGRKKVKSTAKVIYVQVPVSNVVISDENNTVINVVKNQTHSFTCTTGFSRPAAWIQWYIGEKNVTDHLKLQITQTRESYNSSSILKYTGINDDHNKNIYCAAVNIEGRTKIKSTELRIYILIPVAKVAITPSGANNVITVTENRTQNFTCSTNSNRPNATINWYIGGIDLTGQSHQNTEEQSGEMFSTSSSLVYTGRDEDHNQTVYCEAFNIAGRNKILSMYKYIYVQVGPKTVELDPMTPVYQGTENKNISSKIMCSAECRPNCNYTWSGPNRYKNLQSYLQFDTIYRNTSGIYFCIARNEFGTMQSNNITIIVNYPPTIMRLQILNNNTIPEHGAVTLHCGIESHPASNITWNFIRNNTVLNSSTNVLQSNFSISKVQCRDTGTYQCLATNVVDNTHMKDTNRTSLFVQCSSRRDDQKPIEKDEIGLGNGEILNITVYLIAYPKPSIYWTFTKKGADQNTSVAFKNSFGVFEHQSNLQKLESEEDDFGVYTVYAKNTIGEEYIRNFTVSAERTPNKPTNVSVICGIISMTVYWRSEYNGGSTQTFQVIFLNPETNISIQSNVILDEGETNDRNYIAESLDPNTAFVVFVKASNKHGNSKSTDSVNCTTDAVPRTEKIVSSINAIIGGVLGVVCAIILVAVIVVIVHRRRHKKEDTEPIRRNPNENDDEQDDEDGLKENPLYVTSGNVPENGQIYSQVLKTKKTSASSTKEEFSIYSQVNKTEKTGKKGKKDNKTGKKGIQHNVIELDSVYENSENSVKTTSNDVYANGSGISTDFQIRDPCGAQKQKRNKDGLVYADLVFNPSSNGPKFIHGFDDRTIYADVDTTQKIDPMPDSDEEDTNESISENMANDKIVD